MTGVVVEDRSRVGVGIQLRQRWRLPPAGMPALIFAGLLVAAQGRAGATPSTPPTTAIQGVVAGVTASGAASPVKPAVPVAGPLDAVIAQAKATFGADYGGVGSDGVVNVRLATPSMGSPGMSAAALPKTFAGAPVRPVLYSEAELNTFVDGLAKRQLVTSGIYAFGLDSAKNSVVVFAAPNASLAGVRAALTGAAKAVSVVGTRPLPYEVKTMSGIPTLASRTADYGPACCYNSHLGGALIYSNQANCTSGLPWIGTDNVVVMSSAGHCDPPPPPPYYQGSTFYTQAGWYGGDVFDAFWNGHRDVMMLYAGSVWAGFYVGSPNSNGLVYMGAWFPSEQIGTYGLRTSGAVSGEKFVGSSTCTGCNGNVIYTNIVAYFSGTGNVYGLNWAECSAQGGDSGGPVFGIGTNGTIIGAGTITGYNTSDPYHCYYTPVNRIAEQYGGRPY